MRGPTPGIKHSRSESRSELLNVVVGNELLTGVVASAFQVKVFGASDPTCLSYWPHT